MDPFASASGATTATLAPGEDPFAQPASGAYPKMFELFGALLLIRPTKIETVPGYQNKGPNVERITADVTALDTYEGAPQTWDDMFISQASLVGVLKPALRKGGMILGRLHRAPTKENRDKYATVEALEAALQAWRPGMPDVNYTWKLAEFTAEDAAKARAFLASQNG